MNNVTSSSMQLVIRIWEFCHVLCWKINEGIDSIYFFISQIVLSSYVTQTYDDISHVIILTNNSLTHLDVFQANVFVGCL